MGQLFCYNKAVNSILHQEIKEPQTGRLKKIKGKRGAL
jgi:hypothetical protein